MAYAHEYVAAASRARGPSLVMLESSHRPSHTNESQYVSKRPLYKYSYMSNRFRRWGQTPRPRTRCRGTLP